MRKTSHSESVTGVLLDAEDTHNHAVDTQPGQAVEATSTSLALTQEQAALAVRAVFETDLSDEERAAIEESTAELRPLIPFARLRQKQAKGDNGEMIDAGGLAFNDKRADMVLPVDLYMLVAKRVRVYWGAADSITPVCKSDDAHFPNVAVPDPQAETCEKCPRACWPQGTERAERNRPDCNEAWNVLAVLADDPTNPDSGVVVSLHGTALKPLHRYLGTLKRKRVPGLFSVVTRMGSEWVEEGSYSWYKPTFANIGAADPAVYHAIAREFPAYMDAMRRTVAETPDEREPDIADDKDGFFDGGEGVNDATS
jgi:hypothetical protein